MRVRWWLGIIVILYLYDAFNAENKETISVTLTEHFDMETPVGKRLLSSVSQFTRGKWNVRQRGPKRIRLRESGERQPQENTSSIGRFIE